LEPFADMLRSNSHDVDQLIVPTGETSLILAARTAPQDSALKLLELGAKANAATVAPASESTLGDTALHHAADRSLTRLARSLLVDGADPLAKNADGKTPLDLAVDPKLRAMLEEAIADRAAAASPAEEPSVDSPAASSSPAPLSPAEEVPAAP